ncbi:MAG: class SAM-dependent methyltransferase [Solirubrobacterales bacterium]|nr:class SAM-dependent methyltransferase [Solirubrobacterales bacterium]
MDRLTTSLSSRARDLRDRASRRRGPLVPPRRLDLLSHSDFVLTGDEFLHLFTEYGGLRSTDRVLDVGCGLGRMARPLAGFLSGEGSYDGLETDREAIGWCRRRYRRFPRFRFQVADVFDARLNPHGTHRAAEYRFPYDDGSFDFVLLSGVLTHLMPEECEHHLAECARVLAPGGRLFATWFLLNDVSRRLIADGTSGLPFLDAGEPVALLDDALPQEAVAYADDWVFEALRRHGLVLTGLHPGSWCGREEFVTFQDIITAERTEASP